MLFLAALCATVASATAIQRSTTISFQDDLVVEAGGMHNVHITYNAPLDGELSLYYGSCEARSTDECHLSLGKTHVGSHPLAKRHLAHPEQRPMRFVWLPPHNVATGGCLHAFSEGALVGRSAPVTVVSRKNKRWEAAADIMDAEGPWFDGVEYLQEKEPDSVFVASVKSKEFGIIGGGMSGLLTGHLLDSVGIHNWKIIEASSRIGGRVHTSYLNGTRPDEYQYQEMGPMRFPVSIHYTDPDETIEIMDHRMVFQLADVLNKQNGNDSEYQINFIPWIQSADGDPADTSKRRPDGTDNANLTYSNATAVALASDAFDDWIGMDRDRIAFFAKNIFKAHKWAVDNGYFHFSEAGYLRYLKQISSNITDQVDDISDNVPAWEYETVYFDATEWRTIDQGLSRLPAAFGPQVLNRTIFQTAVQGMKWNETTEKMTIEYRNKNLFDIEPETMEFDYVFVSVPFSKVRLWRLPEYSSLLSRAIARLNYDQSCKVALHYKTRFWEHLEHPIFGGCGETDIPQIGSVCYPSYKINSTLPGVILGSYISTVGARSVGSMTEEEHVAYVQRAMVEIHGEVAQEQFTGAYDRICWEFREYQAGAWASPTTDQQNLYLPAYFHTEKHTVFIGESTSYSHAWIFSALESAVRGTTQLLLDMGLVDEAKEITEFWMARWMSM
ncbi:hypothetical protein EJ03DRAFT_319114 [Teratosphaeria nubilosa]|uniref:Amine oxidase domain-containing protein n=1 Tax=Teratosphaeria nubilosa TaxID=161662 RepID=A0A6G1KYA0_9PEZI|nr:hypothetical protein EJ03DRAFT_319114 [Teratosphaeria nubilosa]